MLETTIILLAAGESRRMHTLKQLLDLRGVPLLRHAALTVLESEYGPVVVVLGAHAEELRPALANVPI